mmetsp:Transcript_17684/g.39987  ORF Transcript_17684/g.39987 Transcript_17684/m.39987 type:complete len:215 (+) Transcript_17684:580-1224(+)
MCSHGGSSSCLRRQIHLRLPPLCYPARSVLFDPLPEIILGHQLLLCERSAVERIVRVREEVAGDNDSICDDAGGRQAHRIHHECLHERIKKLLVGSLNKRVLIDLLLRQPCHLPPQLLESLSLLLSQHALLGQEIAGLDEEFLAQQLRVSHKDREELLVDAHRQQRPQGKGEDVSRLEREGLGVLDLELAAGLTNEPIDHPGAERCDSCHKVLR